MSQETQVLVRAFGPWLGPFSRLAQVAAPAARSKNSSLLLRPRRAVVELCTRAERGGAICIRFCDAEQEPCCRKGEVCCERGAGRSRAYRLQGRSGSFVNALSSHLLLCTYVVLCPRSGFDSLTPCSYLFDFSSPTCVCGCVYACVSAGRRRTDRVIGLHGSRRPFSLASLVASPDCVVGDLG